MNSPFHRTLAAGALALTILTAACSDSATAPRASATLANALSLGLAGNDQAQTSFVGAPSEISGRGFSIDDGPHDGGGFMGGGLGEHFLGDAFGPDHHHGRFAEDDLDGTCVFSATSGRVECQPVEHHGLTVVRSAAYTDARGNVQQARDSLTTNTINALTTVRGTVVFDGRRGHHDDGDHHPDDSSASDDARRPIDTSVVALTSNRTVSGLASGSAQRTVNSKSAGTETTTGTDSTGHFTIVRVAGDTTTGLIIPVSATGQSYPTAGTIVRAMQATLTYDRGTPASTHRREVITFDGSAVARLVITHDGTTKNCTIALPHGRPVCQ